MGKILHLPKLEHLESILYLNQKSLPALSGLSEDQLKHLMTESDYFKTLIINHKIIGFLIAFIPGKNYNSLNYKWFENKYRSFVYIDRVTISQDFQRKGYGKLFYDDLMIFARKHSSRLTCEINIKPKNLISLNFHKRYGFKEVGTQKTDDGKKEVLFMKYEF